MVRPSGRVKSGELLQVSPTLFITAVDRIGEGRWRVRFHSKRERAQIIASAGHIPLPPYMRRGDEPTDIRRYQTVYARKNAIGSVAAPTAGFHFTRGLLQRIESQGVKTSRVTLHVGPGTFLPVHADHLGEHEMESEMAELSQQTARLIAQTKVMKKRVIAVGTTTVRTLESAPIQNGLPVPYHTPVNLFIRPGFRFQVVDALITNFHLPRSTLLVLVSTFAGRELILEAYQAAIREKYRFYSYGDAMLIL
jgi:S-adenosylmethionine:tRNA ribosyltransferase-isomerase